MEDLLTRGLVLITFKIAQHTIKNVEIVEIFKDGRFVGALYPGNEQTNKLGEDDLCLISSHVKKHEIMTGIIDPESIIPDSTIWIWNF